MTLKESVAIPLSTTSHTSLIQGMFAIDPSLKICESRIHRIGGIEHEIGVMESER